MADDVPSAAATSGGEAVLGHRFLWLSDVHLDPYYGTSRAFRESYDDGTKCDDSDDGDEDRTTGSYGCDSPPALVLGAIDAARREFKVDGEENGPSFVIVTGDAVRHGIDQLFASGRNFEEGSESRVENDDNDNNSSSAMDGAAIASYHDEAMIEAGKVMGTVASYLRTAFPNATVVICLGNNDVVPDYYLELYEDKERREDGHGNGDDGGMPTPQNAGMLGVLYDALVGDDVDEDGTSSSILTYEDMSTFLRGGYYHRTFHDGSLIVLSLNTVLYSSFHGPMMHRNVDDPGGQFEWMRTTLDDCRRRRRQMSSSSVAAAAEDGIGCSAMIVGHVPPAMGSYRHQQLWKEGYIRT
jgi:sphingomyelin phosphodiesterase acid-like 3